MATGSSSKSRKNRIGQGDDPAQADPYTLIVPVRSTIAVVAVGAAVAFGFARLNAKLPQGDFLVLGGVAWLRFEESPLSANVIDNWEGDFSLGTTGTVDVDLADAGEANILASTAIGPAASGVLVRARYAVPPVAASINNNAGGGLNLNLLLDAASVTDGASPTILVTGSISLVLAGLGKNA